MRARVCVRLRACVRACVRVREGVHVLLRSRRITVVRVGGCVRVRTHACLLSHTCMCLFAHTYMCVSQSDIFSLIRTCAHVCVPHFSCVYVRLLSHKLISAFLIRILPFSYVYVRASFLIRALALSKIL